MTKKELSFDQLIELYNHIGEEERHFNTLELEYRKLASQWLLVSLGAIGFVLTKQELMPLNVWALVIAICIAASVGIFVLWLLDLKVYHELLHAAFVEGVALENYYPPSFISKAKRLKLIFVKKPQLRGYFYAYRRAENYPTRLWRTLLPSPNW